MNDAQFFDLCAWLTEAGLSGQSETVTLDGFCERAVALGLPLARTTVLIDTSIRSMKATPFFGNAIRRKRHSTSMPEAIRIYSFG